MPSVAKASTFYALSRGLPVEVGKLRLYRVTECPNDPVLINPITLEKMPIVPAGISRRVAVRVIEGDGGAIIAARSGFKTDQISRARRNLIPW